MRWVGVSAAGLLIAFGMCPNWSSASVSKAVTQVSASMKLPQRTVRHLATVVAAGLIFSASTLTTPQDASNGQGAVVFAANDGEEEDVWHKLPAQPAAHQRAVFYLVVDLFEYWRVAHVAYVGDDHDGKPLFVSLRNHIISDNKPVFGSAVTSLVGHDGLVQENIDIEEVAHFPSNATVPYFDITLLKIHALDMSDYEPLSLAHGVYAEHAVQMLSYRVDLAADLLHFFAYPLRYRPCHAGAVVMMAEHPVLLHTCSIPHSPAVAGSPLFSTGDTPALVALYISTYKDGFDYAVPMPFELIHRFSDTLAVTASDKMTTSWGALKQRDF